MDLTVELTPPSLTCLRSSCLLRKKKDLCGRWCLDWSIEVRLKIHQPPIILKHIINKYILVLWLGLTPLEVGE